MACIDGVGRVMRGLGMTLPSFDIKLSTEFSILKRKEQKKEER
jgi:hypothetical protein